MGESSASERLVVNGQKIAIPLGAVIAICIFLWRVDETIDVQRLHVALLTSRVESLEGELSTVAELRAEIAGLEKRIMGLRDQVDSWSKYTRTTQDGRIEQARRETAELAGKVGALHSEGR